MELPQLRELLFAYIRQKDSENALYEWHKTANEIGITKQQLEYVVSEIGRQYFIENKSGFFTTNKCFIEAKYEIKPKINEQKGTSVIGNGNTVIYDSSLVNSEINPFAQIKNNKTEHNPPIKSDDKNIWVKIAFWAGLIASAIGIYEFIIKKFLTI